MLRPRSWPARAVAALLLLGVLALGARFGPSALGGRGHATGEPSGGAAIDALLSRAGSAVVFSEFGIDSDSLWAANPADPADRVLLGTAPHAAGFSVFPSLSPDGTRIAYTVLPTEGPAGSSDPLSGSTAQLRLLDTRSGATRTLVDGIDLRSAPVWAPGSDAIVVRRSRGTESSAGSELVRAGLSGSTETVVSQAAGLYPIAVTPDGASLYYATLSAAGTDLMRAPLAPGAAGPSGEGQPVAHLSDGIARNWHLSPDGRQLAYLASSAGATTAYVAQVLDIDTGAVHTPLGGDAGAQFNPVWARDGTITVGRLGGRAPLRITIDGGSATPSGEGLPASASGFDVPLLWSPDGSYLIVRAFEGSASGGPADPGPSRVVAITAGGARNALSPQSDVEIAGWLQVAP